MFSKSNLNLIHTLLPALNNQLIQLEIECQDFILKIN